MRPPDGRSATPSATPSAAPSDPAPFLDGWLRRVLAVTEHELNNEVGDTKLEIARLRALLRTAFSHAPLGMAMVNGADEIVIANEALCVMVCQSAEQLVGRAWPKLFTLENGEAPAEYRRQILTGEVARHRMLTRLRRADGNILTARLTMAADGLQPPTVICQVEDVTEQQKLQEQLEHLVDHDLLTGLHNRRRFEQELDREVARSSREALGGALLMIDLDGFKEVNDQFGHAAGDRLLRGIAAAMSDRARSTDFLARLSGDEFAMLLPGASRDTVEHVARDLLAVIAGHAAVFGAESAHVTASIGASLLDGASAPELFELADAAMYAAKAAGRNRLVVHDPRARQLPGAVLNEAAQLRRALREDRFVLYCQPICAPADHAVDQYELLIRMRGDAPGELIAPNAFLYAAERFGLITEIDAWMVSRAAALIAGQARKGRRVVLSVNLSGRSIGNAGLAAHIDEVLDDSRIDPACLIFEITETAAIANVRDAQEFTEHLRRRGCRIALDDFGAGFASFYYLKALPFDFIKIDGNFVQGLTTSATDQLVVIAIVSVARGMHKQTIAEHVTDQPTSDLLAAHGVDLVQGFHIAAPRPVETVFAELAAP